MGSRFVEILRYFDGIINQTLRDVVSDYSFETLALLALFSFAYGILHSLGPGHGKALVASYFLKEKHHLRKAVFLSAFISFVHTGTAIILSFLLYYVLTGVRGIFRIQLQSYFMITSGIMITIIGILFLLVKIFHNKANRREETSWGKRGFLLVGFSGGIIPCPVSSMIMMLTISNRVAHIGLISVIGISLGMFIVLMLIGILSISSRQGIMIVSGRFFKRTDKVSKIIEFLSIVLIIFIGLSLVSPLFF